MPVPAGSGMHASCDFPNFPAAHGRPNAPTNGDEVFFETLTGIQFSRTYVILTRVALSSDRICSRLQRVANAFYGRTKSGSVQGLEHQIGAPLI